MNLSRAIVDNVRDGLALVLTQLKGPHTMAEESAPSPEQKTGSKRSMFTVGLVAGVAIAEAALFFGVIKFMGGGTEDAFGADKHVLDDASADGDVATKEIELLRGFRVPNTKSGQTIIYDLDVTVVVPAESDESFEELKTMIDGRIGEISDRAAQIMRAATPRVLSEDDLQTLRAQFEHALSDVLRDTEIVRKVLIPRCVPIRTG